MKQNNNRLKGVCVGAGYFSRFHLEAWSRITEVEIVSICDIDTNKANLLAKEFDIPTIYTNVLEMIDLENPDFIDIITPPTTHEYFCTLAIERKIAIICQKPFTSSLSIATGLVASAQENNVPLMVHENFRFQPWYRTIKKLLETQVIGDSIFNASFRMRTGDGCGKDAYLYRQPFFRNMPRLLVYETGIHFIDTFRYLFGNVKSVFAHLKHLNPHIVGEDAGMIFFEFDNGTTALWDANRYNEPNYQDARYTFGEMLIEGNSGSIRLYPNGGLTIQLLGTKEQTILYSHEQKNFAGDCVFMTQSHFIDSLLSGKQFETSGLDYLDNITIQEAIYKSNQLKQVVLMT